MFPPSTALIAQRDRTINLGAGPCPLPTSVLRAASQGLLNYEGTGIGLVELSHRSRDFQNLNSSAQAGVRQLLDVPENFDVLFMQGGGLLQFSCVVMNLVNGYRLKNQTRAEDQVSVDYLVTGSWSLKASQEAQRLGARVNIIADSRTLSSDSSSFRSIPEPEHWKFDNQNHKPPAFVYYCDNETVDGVELPSSGFPIEALPESYQHVPLVADMSSNLMSRRIPSQLWNRLGVVFAGAQKNMGPPGLTVVIIRRDLIIDLDDALPYGGIRSPAMLSYKNMSDNQSLYNTPPMFSIYVCDLVFKDLLSKTGKLERMESINAEKSELVYKSIDKSDGFYLNRINTQSRSRMNVVFNIQGGPSIEDQFITQAQSIGIKQIKGHRSVPHTIIF